MSRKAAEREADAARELAYDARRRVDRMRSSQAERDLDAAMEARRRGMGLSHDEYGPSGHELDPPWAGGGMHANAVRDLMREDPGHDDLGAIGPQPPAAPERTRGHVLLLR